MITKMKSMKLIASVAMLLATLTVSAQGEYYDDVYFSSSKAKKTTKVEEKKVQQPTTRNTTSTIATPSTRTSSDNSEGRDVDEYNRRSTSVGVDEPYNNNEDQNVNAQQNNKSVSAQKDANSRTSDSEYSERIVRYHSPSKITIAGADQVDLYLSNGYYGYDFF